MKKLLLCLLLLASCAGPGRLSTPSGRAEIVVSNATLKEVKDRCVAALMVEGYTVDATTEYSVAMLKIVGPDSWSGAPQKVRATFDFAERSEGVTVYHKMVIIDDPDTDKAYSANMDSQSELIEQQERLNRIAAQFASR